MSFYAVQAGRSPGVYRSWEDCSKQVHKYPKAIYKKFSTMSEATRFLQHPTYSYKPTEKVPASLVHTGSAEYLPAASTVRSACSGASAHAEAIPKLNLFTRSVLRYQTLPPIPSCRSTCTQTDPVFLTGLARMLKLVWVCIGDKIQSITLVAQWRMGHRRIQEL